MAKIIRFEDLEGWKKGHRLAVRIYKVTDNFPSKEIFGITNQLRRAGVSITSNIAEGFGRRSIKEKVQFYRTALGSLNEVRSQLYIVLDVGYLTKEDFKLLMSDLDEVAKILNALIKSLNNLNTNI